LSGAHLTSGLISRTVKAPVVGENRVTSIFTPTRPGFVCVGVDPMPVVAMAGGYAAWPST
jgi:hypothetical protein